METLLHDLRYGLRMLVKSPGFTVVAILTLALGIGANTAIFSLTDQVLLRLLPVERPDDLVVLRSPGLNPGHTSSDGDDAASFSYPMYKDLRQQNQVFSGLLARYAISLSVSGQGHTERAAGELVSGNYFQVLGVTPALGRVFAAQDETAPGANPVAVLSYGYWTRRYGDDPAILNKQLSVNGTLLTVVGVAHAGFTGVQIGQLPDVFIPITMKAQMTPNWNGLEDHKDHWAAMLGRIKPGLSHTQVEAGLQATYRALLESELPLMKLSSTEQQQFLGRRLLLVSGAHGRPVLQQDTQAPLVFVNAMVGLVLLIACANLASLLVARGEARQREVAVRLSLGAGRWRLVRQLLTESFLLALAGGAAGVAFAWWTLKVLVGTISTGTGVHGLDARLDHRVLIFAVALSILTGVLFGLAPALRATHVQPQLALKDQGSTVSTGVSNVRLRKWLIVSQVALTAVLLIGAGLFAQSLVNLRRLDLGLRADHAVEFSLAPELNRYSPAQTVALCDRIRQDVAVLPGVRSVSAARVPVLAGDDWGSNVTIEGYAPQPNEDLHVFRNAVGPDYFAAMGTPLLGGREFTQSDTSGSSKVAIINETLARRFFAGRNPVGRRFAFGGGNNVQLDIEIVGVVKDSKHTSVRDDIRPFAYMPYAQDPALGHVTFYVRTIQDPTSMATMLRKTVAVIDPALPLFDLATLEEQVDQSMFTDRMVTFLSVCLALVASVLAAIGLYGVMAYVVSRRTREIGIRMALGATRGGVAWLVLREVMLMVVIGLAVGLVGALAIGRLIESQLFGVKASDPLVLAVAVALLTGTALLAGGLPARKAATVDPMVALRYE